MRSGEGIRVGFGDVTVNGSNANIGNVTISGEILYSVERSHNLICGTDSSTELDSWVANLAGKLTHEWYNTDDYAQVNRDLLYESEYFQSCLKNEGHT